MKTYIELRKQQQEEFNAFPVKFAFSKEQFKEMMESWGLKEKDTKKIVSVGGAGFILLSDKKAYVEMIARHSREHQDAIKADSTGDGYIKDMFYTELSNHEFGYTAELDDTLEALSLTMDEIDANPALRHGLELAMSKFY